MVDVKLVRRFAEPLTRDQLANDEVASKMLVLKRGMRLSIQPVSPAEWAAVLQLAGMSTWHES
jgi:predicted RNA-binding protein with PUA-like domain